MNVLKRISLLGLSVFAVSTLASCGGGAEAGTSQAGSSTPAASSSAPSQTQSSQGQDSKKPVNVFLAGDSTVQTYDEETYIAGWGQYFNLFFEDNVNVINCARGGRSARSFINEDRLFKNTDGTKYNFSENGGKSIEESIGSGDYLFIQFGHNDDDTKGYTTMPDRMTPLGTKDANGVYPVTAPEEMKETTYLPASYISQASAEEKAKVEKELLKYGQTYYAYGDGTFKWYLKQYVDLARSKGATPVLCTPVARKSFNGDGTLKSGAGLHGDNFAYVEAVKQLAQEENCLLIDNFEFTKDLFETTTSANADYLMALKPNDAKLGAWPVAYDKGYGNSSLGITGIEATHYNKYGSYLIAAFMADNMIAQKDVVKTNGEKFGFVDSILSAPSAYIEPSRKLKSTLIPTYEAMFTNINIHNENTTALTPEFVEDAIWDIFTFGGKDGITSENVSEADAVCKRLRAMYDNVFENLRGQISNYSDLTDCEAVIASLK